MTERREIQIPVWCSALCRNAFNQKCVEECSVKHDCSYFEEKPNLNLSNMPRFPETRGMTKEEKFTSVTVYLSKVVDHLQGNEAEKTIYPQYRRNGERNQRTEISQVQDLLASLLENSRENEEEKE